jgi:ribosomal protein L11 methyltransferase
VGVADTRVGRMELVADLVVANIGAATLVDLAPHVGARVAAGGWLVLSGLLAGQADDVVAAFVHEGLTERWRPELERWVAPVLERTGVTVAGARG